MDLILWRHAEAEDLAASGGDLARALTARGEKQAERVGAWLARQLPQDALVLCSPARRAQQTVRALGRSFQTRDELAPDCDVDTVLGAAGWPGAAGTVVIVGHQPVLGETVAQLLGMASGTCAVRKGAVWWLRARERGGDAQPVVWAVMSPEAL